MRGRSGSAVAGSVDDGEAGGGSWGSERFVIVELLVEVAKGAISSASTADEIVMRKIEEFTEC